jgi:hypothetical protein
MKNITKASPFQTGQLRDRLMKKIHEIEKKEKELSMWRRFINWIK